MKRFPHLARVCFSLRPQRCCCQRPDRLVPPVPAASARAHGCTPAYPRARLVPPHHLQAPPVHQRRHVPPHALRADTFSRSPARAAAALGRVHRRRRGQRDCQLVGRLNRRALRRGQVRAAPSRLADRPRTDLVLEVLASEDDEDKPERLKVLLAGLLHSSDYVSPLA